ncbi:unnamed protein product [Pleuronectes platessa]|uniref:Uncharacterized protein n=1 Tax=Pleuronectes platessa TaxID=8262 RepID=A0A9N7Z152_PLEPL|nr:unnamed protein product [Pleuronectes platessa]
MPHILTGRASGLREERRTPRPALCHPLRLDVFHSLSLSLSPLRLISVSPLFCVSVSQPVSVRNGVNEGKERERGGSDTSDPPPFIASLSSRHLTETGSSGKSPKAQSYTIVHTTKREGGREGERVEEKRKGGGEIGEGDVEC